jgi:hypothetical protein
MFNLSKLETFDLMCRTGFALIAVLLFVNFYVLPSNAAPEQKIAVMSAAAFFLFVEFVRFLQTIIWGKGNGT